MRLSILIVLSVFQTSNCLSCGCGGPSNDLKTDILRTESIFVGVITKINKDHVFHLSQGSGFGYKYINFDVIKINKGINPAQLKVSVFDDRSNTSCEGLIGHKEVGDTILVFANEFNQWMLGSNLCGRTPTLSELSFNEQTFFDTTVWIDPKANYSNSNEYIERNFLPNVNIPSKNIPSSSTFIYAILIAVVFLIIGLMIGKRCGKKKNFKI